MKRIFTAALAVTLAACILCLSLTGCSSAKGKTLLTLEKDGKTATLSVNLYELMLSRIKGALIGSGVTNGGYSPTDDAFWNVLDNYGESDEKQTCADYYSNLILENCKTYVAAEWLFESEGRTLSDKAIANADSKLEDLLNSYGSKTKLNAVLSDYGVNYAMLREAYLLEEKVAALQEQLYGQNASLVGSAVKNSYLAEHYVRFRQIVLPLYRYVYETDECDDAIWYQKESNLSKIAYDYKNGYTRQNEDGTPVTDANGDEIAFQTPKAPADKKDDRICYDTENGIRSYKMNGSVAMTEEMTAEEIRQVKEKAKLLFAETEPLDDAAFEARMAEVNEYPTGEDKYTDGYYLSIDVDYASAGDSLAYLSELIGKLKDAEAGTVVLVESGDAIHIVRKYAPTEDAYDLAENETFFQLFNTSLIEDLFLEKCRELFDFIEVNEKVLASATDIRRIGANLYLY